MVVRRNNSRRRRLVLDPAASPSSVQATMPKRSSSRKKTESEVEARPYAYGADRRCQPKTTDLIPKRFLSVALVILALVSCLGVLNFAASQVGNWTSFLGESATEAFSLRGAGSISNWFSSFLFILTGLASLQIYALRKHRCDDYRGTYRIWLWLAAVLLVASVNCVVSLQSIVASLAAALFRGSVVSSPWLPIVTKLVLLTLLVIRGLVEVRQSRVAFGLVMCVWATYSGAILLESLTQSDQVVGMDREFMLGNCYLFANVGLFLASLTYARHIYLLAHGMIQPRQKRQAATKTKTTQKRSAKKKATKAAAKKTTRKATTRKTRTTKKATPKPAPVEVHDDVVEDTPEIEATSFDTQEESNVKVNRKPTLKELADASRQQQADEQDELEEPTVKMTKSQRRKLRKQQKQNRRRAA